MNLEEFENQYRESLDHTLNKLQTATLLLSLAEATIMEVGTSVQVLSQKVEAFITQQKSTTLKTVVNEDIAAEDVIQTNEQLINQANLLNIQKKLSEQNIEQLIKKIIEQQQDENT